jgi:transposase, IS5 family
VRTTILKQPDIFSTPVEHQLADELREIDGVINAHPEWVRWVHADLTKARRVSASAGREGMSANQVLRVVLLKHRLNLSVRKLAPFVADSLSLREFLDLGLADSAPKRSTIQDNVVKVRPETWGRLLLGFARADEVKTFESGEKVAVDATVTAANIHMPSDSSLIWDSVRVLTRVLKRAQAIFGVAFDDHTKETKRLQRKIYFMSGKGKRVPAYSELLAIAEKVSGQVKDAIAALERREVRSKTLQMERALLLKELGRFRGLLIRVIDQTKRRVLNGEKVPAQEKVLSIFEPHADLIVKSKTQPAEYGHKVTLTRGASGFVLDCVIERGNPVDSSLATRQLKRQKKLFGRAPESAAFDGGYASRENLEQAKALGVEKCAFSKGRGLTPKEMAGSRRTYQRLRNFRASIESTVSMLKRAYGLTVCTWKGWTRFQSYVWSAVLAANLTLLARRQLCTT